MATSFSQNTTGNPMSTPPIPSNLRSLPIETITIKEEITSDNEQDPPLQTSDGKDKERKGVECPICKKAVQNDLMLNAHLKSEHKMPANPTKPQTNPQTNSPSDRHSPKIKCQICHINLESQYMLEEHISNEHGCKIFPQRLFNTNPPQMSPQTNEYNPPLPCPNMNPNDTEFYRNYPWESRVRAANRRIYKTSEHERYKEVISCLQTLEQNILKHSMSLS